MSVAASDQAVPELLSRGSVERLGTAEVSEGALVAQPVRVVVSGHEKGTGGVRPEARTGQKVGGGPSRRADRAQRRARAISASRSWTRLPSERMASFVALATSVLPLGRKPAALSTRRQAVRRRSSPRSSSGAVETRLRSWLSARARSLRALERATRSTRIAFTLPFLFLSAPWPDPTGRLGRPRWRRGGPTCPHGAAPGGSADRPPRRRRLCPAGDG